jgi:DNA helicase II / ATP-dependent DNA helicase PcrA
MPDITARQEHQPVDSPLLAGLNVAQRQAVETVDGPVLVIAGAGSGKTRVLTHRLAHLVGHHGIPADRIMAITFTNKAAGEMAARVEGLIGVRHAERAWVTTFHKTGVRILRREAAALDLKSGFTIYDGQDALRLIARLAKDAGIDDKRLPPRAIAGAISRAKDELLGAGIFPRARLWLAGGRHRTDLCRLRVGAPTLPRARPRRPDRADRRTVPRPP